jgi:hypothetical protein
MVDGRLFAIDLEGGGGLSWGGVPRASGWVDSRMPVRVGSASLRVAGGPSEQGGTVPGPGPTSSRFESRQVLPVVVLEVRGAFGKPRPFEVDRVLTLVGGSERCHLRVSDPDGSRFVAALVRTRSGIWAVDLLSTQGLVVNGAACRVARLEDGDLLGVGPQSIRVTYKVMPATVAQLSGLPDEGPTDLPDLPAQSPRALPPLPAHRALPPSRTAPRQPYPLGRGPGHDPRGLSALDPDEFSDLFPPSSMGDAMSMLVGLLRDLHRDQIAMVREELSAIRRLNEKVEALQSQITQPAPPPPPSAAPPERAAGDPGSMAVEPNLDIPNPWPSPTRPGPHMIQFLVGERLEAWERERQSRWRRVLGLLTRS